jgi:hypothetical protein
MGWIIRLFLRDQDFPHQTECCYVWLYILGICRWPSLYRLHTSSRICGLWYLIASWRRNDLIPMYCKNRSISRRLEIELIPRLVGFKACKQSALLMFTSTRLGSAKYFQRHIEKNNHTFAVCFYDTNIQ